MKRIYRSIAAGATMAGIFIFTACDWSSGSQENFNISGGSSNVNISGFYKGINGGRIVANTSRGNILSLTIQQSGNRVDVRDNQGSTYVGTIGAPLVSDDLTDGAIAPGAVAASFQISFSGKDGVAARDINFTGVLTIVTIADIQGRTGGTDSTRDTTTTTTTTGVPVVNPDGSTTSTDSTSNSTSNSNDTTNYTFTLTGPTTQLQIQGTWAEIGGVVSSVNGFGPPAQGNLQVPVGGN